MMRSLAFWYVITLAIQVAVLTMHGVEKVTPMTITLVIMIELALPPLVRMYVVEMLEKWQKGK